MSRYLMVVATGILGVFFSDAATEAQVVQLPTFRQFGMSTSVMVPDRGGAYLGGVSRAADSSSSYGIPIFGKLPGVGRLGQNRAISSTRDATFSSVHATIIDFNELDPARGMTPPTLTANEVRAQRIAANVARSNTVARPATRQHRQPTNATVVGVRLRNAQAAQQRSHEAVDFYRRGLNAEQSGKRQIAKIYFRMAASRATGRLKDKSNAALHRVSHIVVAERSK